MILRILVLLGAFVCTAASAQSLDDWVRELKRRVEQLEKQLAKPALPTASKPTTSQSNGGQQRESWRTLKRGMAESDVRSILGEPNKVSALRDFTFWHYPDGGRVQFGSNERVEGWNEPY